MTGKHQIMPAMPDQAKMRDKIVLGLPAERSGIPADNAGVAGSGKEEAQIILSEPAERLGIATHRALKHQQLLVLHGTSHADDDYRITHICL